MKVSIEKLQMVRMLSTWITEYSRIEWVTLRIYFRWITMKIFIDFTYDCKLHSNVSEISKSIRNRNILSASSLNLSCKY